METDPHGPEIICFLEVQRRVVRIGLQQSECPVGQSLDVCRQISIAAPEIRGGVVDHRTVERPDSWSRRARSARDRSLPFLASASIWSSHASASNRANQSRKSFSSSKPRLFTCPSMCSTRLISSSTTRLHLAY